MILVTQSERKALELAGVLKPKKKLRGGGYQDSNFTVVNRSHKGKDKQTYVAETPDIMAFLGKFEELNLQKIRPEQLESLKISCGVNEAKIQNWGEYNPSATVFFDQKGQIYCKKIAQYMFVLGIWKNKSNSYKTSD